MRENSPSIISQALEFISMLMALCMLANGSMMFDTEKASSHIPTAIPSQPSL